MSSLSMSDKRLLERLLGMSSGYVLGFSDRTFGDFVIDAVGADIHSDRYTADGTSKAKKLRAFWTVESDQMVGTLLSELIKYWETSPHPRSEEENANAEHCRRTVARLLAAGPSLHPLKEHAATLSATHLADQRACGNTRS